VTDNANPAAELDRLHTLLDKQPSCLMRVAIDGMLLAVSDAALVLLGGSELAQMLGTNLVDRIHGDSGTLWTDFVDRVCQSGSGSVECELDDLRGARRTVMLLSIAVSDHPDGLASLLVSVRDMSAARRLETSLEEQEGIRRALQASLDKASTTVKELRERLEHAIDENRQLNVALETAVAERVVIAASVDDLTNALNTAMHAVSVTRGLIGRPVSE
jgi:hypothetical protein